MTKLLEIDGLPVRDARRSIVLTVTAQDIKSATTKEPADCAVAKACRRGLHVVEAKVHLSRVYLRTSQTGWVRYVTPRSMRSEIIAFDRGGAFEPSTFTLAAPQPAKKLGKKSGGTGPYVKRGKKRRRPHVMSNVRAIAA